MVGHSQFVVSTNIFFNYEKYILQWAQIHFDNLDSTISATHREATVMVGHSRLKSDREAQGGNWPLHQHFPTLQNTLPL